MEKERHGSISWRVWHGSTTKDVQALVKEQLDQQAKPLLVYRDPVNGPDPIAGFAGLAAPDRVGGEAALAEARLFYLDGLLHVVSDGTGARWAVWCEGSHRPSWFEVSGEGGPPKLSATYRDQDVLLRRRPGPGDVHTGLSHTQLGDKQVKQVGVRLYYEAGVLQGWRLNFDGKQSAT
ncbi:MAG: hypothetical protein GX575_29355 [Candidatus Anammoximicrobium sp.]|nr:hypothetical protein [Candidatus Anammoximicrobium sp.]